jgi:hypothetical protein
MSEKYAVAMIGTDCLILDEFYDPVEDRKDVRFLTFDSFRNKTMNQKCVNPWRTGSGSKYKAIGPLWLSSGLRREYENVVFDPTEKVNGKYYNLFQGFRRKPQKGDWSLLNDHIFNMVCHGDENLFHYVLSWMARIVQDPGGKRPGVALVFRGVQGCGKGVVIRALGEILKPHFRHILHIAHLTGKFNLHLKDALLVFLDEITWGGDKTTEGILKGLITEPTVRIEPKKKDSIEITSHINVAIASNSDWCVPVSTHERRFCVLDVLPDHKDDSGYWRKLYDQLDNGGYEAMHYDLSRYPLHDVNLRTVPRTRGLLEQILNSFSTVHKFWYQCLFDGLLLLSHNQWEKEIKCYTLYNYYLQFCDSLGRKSFNITSAEFGKKLRELCPSMRRSRLQDSKERDYSYVFPDLEQCRQEFSDAVKQSVDWENDEFDILEK